MLRVGELNIAWSLCNQIAEIMQRPLDGAISIATPVAPWARAAGKIAAALHDLGSRQVFNTSDSFGTIGSVFSRSQHGHPPW